MNRFQKTILTVAVLAIFMSPTSARGDGGMVRFAQVSGDYRLTVFTSPTPLRQGPVDFSVLVQDARTGQTLSDADVAFDLIPLNQQATPKRYAATHAAATNKLLQAAVFDLPAAGNWRVETSVAGPCGSIQVAFLIRATQASPRWMDLGMWIILPAVPVFFFGIQQFFNDRTNKKRL